MRGFEAAAWRGEASVKKTMTGSGMVTTTKDVTVTFESGRSELLKAGVSRLDPGHPLVKQCPSLFRPCDQSDRPTVARMLELAGTRTRVLEQTRTQRPRVHGRHQLKTRRPTRNKLR